MMMCHGGSDVAKFAGLNVHQRLAKEEAYINGDYYEVALKNAFLGTDEDILSRIYAIKRRISLGWL